jgi:hypothetical protein
MKTTLYAIFLLLLWATSCKQPVETKMSEEVPATYQASVAKMPNNIPDSSALLLADSLIYDVVLRAPKNEDEWAAYCLRNVDIQTLANQIFDAIYSGKLQAYHYSSMEKMSIEQVKEFEAQSDNKRSAIAKAQFEEQWFFDPTTARMVKKVTGLMLAYEINAAQNRYRAGIKVLFPN